MTKSNWNTTDRIHFESAGAKTPAQRRREAEQAAAAKGKEVASHPVEGPLDGVGV